MTAMHIERDEDGNVRAVFTSESERFAGKWREDRGQTDAELRDKALVEHFASLVRIAPVPLTPEGAARRDVEAESRHRRLVDGITGGRSAEVVAEYTAPDGDRKRFRVQARHNAVNGLHYVGVYDHAGDGALGQPVTASHETYDDAAADIGIHLTRVRDPHELVLNHPAAAKQYGDVVRARSEEAVRLEAERANDAARAEIVAAYGAEKAKRATVAVRRPDGSTESITGHVLGPFIIHKSPSGYDITHVGSGERAGVGRYGSLESARLAAALMACRYDWGFDGVDRKPSRDLLVHGSRVQKLLGRGDFAALKAHLDSCAASVPW